MTIEPILIGGIIGFVSGAGLVAFAWGERGKDRDRAEQRKEMEGLDVAENRIEVQVKGWRPPAPHWAHHCSKCGELVANDNWRHYQDFCPALKERRRHDRSPPSQQPPGPE